MADINIEKLGEFIDNYKSLIVKNYGNMRDSYTDREKVKVFFNDVTPEKIKLYSEEDMKIFFSHYWSKIGFTPNKIVKNNNLSVLKDFISKVYESKSIDESLWSQKINWIGASIKSEMVSKINNEEFILVNSRTRVALSEIGYHLPKGLANITWKKYLEIIDVCLTIGNEMKVRGMKEHSLYDVDGLLYYISMMSEKKDAASDSKSERIAVDHAWYVGAYSSANGDDMSDKFITEGKWAHDSKNAQVSEAVKKVKAGDRIVMKATHTLKKVDDFENYGKPVSVMNLIAKGIVRRNPGDGINLDVDWERIPDNRGLWYFFTYLKVIWNVNRSENEEKWMHGDLLDFTFKGESQDIDRFLSAPYWSDKYGAPREVTEDDARTYYEDKRCDDYSKDDFLKDVFMEPSQYERIARALELKKNIILQGAPGVGKTYCAKRLAYSILRGKDESRVKCIQFHQNYSYEEFMIGYRPEEGGSFTLRDGVFIEFCDKARSDPDNKFFFIIDEINRGNLSKILGEAMMLIEADKRGSEQADLAYRREGTPVSFSVPDNVYIIGTMNTADRSLAMMDYALRRRFAFIEMEPAFDNPGFKEMLSARCGDSKAGRIIAKFQSLNETIEADRQLGRGFRIGHSYLCDAEYDRLGEDMSWYNDVLEFEIKPLLEEYWYDQPNKVKEEAEKLKVV